MEYNDYMDEEFFDDDNDDNEAEEKSRKEEPGEKDNDILKSLWEKSEEQNEKQQRAKSTKPRPKFTERELVSNKGLPALKALFDGYKVNNSLNPYENMNQIMSKVEYWAHNLFPQYNFDDFLERVEIIGRKRLVRVSMHKMRMGMPLDDDDANEIQENIEQEK